MVPLDQLIDGEGIATVGTLTVKLRYIEPFSFYKSQ